LALGLHDVVVAQAGGPGLTVEVTGVGATTVERGEGHLVVRAMRAGFDAVGEQPTGLMLRCHNAIPQGFGLGSSAGAIVAGLLAARALCGKHGARLLPDDVVLRRAVGLEGHADNVAACLAGGLTIAWTGPGGSVGCARLAPMPGLTPVLCVPAEGLPTEKARAVLPASVPHADAAKNAARAALLIAALTHPGARLSGPRPAGSGLSTPRPAPAGPPAPDQAQELLLAATEDFLHQPYRAGSMPGTASLVAALRAAGIPAVVSGAGPAVLALITPGAAARPEAVAAIAARSGPDWTVRVLDVDHDGATVLEPGASVV
jgi:homoserine kinase